MRNMILWTKRRVLRRSGVCMVFTLLLWIAATALHGSIKKTSGQSGFAKGVKSAKPLAVSIR